uniref:Uncharacterized protein n=1 Tax=Knipowitschia caucasica TaxID=637954 RepID=A0AAV2M640_KNICA
MPSCDKLATIPPEELGLHGSGLSVDSDMEVGASFTGDHTESVTLCLDHNEHTKDLQDQSDHSGFQSYSSAHSGSLCDSSAHSGSLSDRSDHSGSLSDRSDHIWSSSDEHEEHDRQQFSQYVSYKEMRSLNKGFLEFFMAFASLKNQVERSEVLIFAIIERLVKIEWAKSNMDKSAEATAAAQSEGGPEECGSGSEEKEEASVTEDHTEPGTLDQVLNQVLDHIKDLLDHSSFSGGSEECGSGSEEEEEASITEDHTEPGTLDQVLNQVLDHIKDLLDHSSFLGGSEECGSGSEEEEEASVTEDHTESGTLDHVLKQVLDHIKDLLDHSSFLGGSEECGSGSEEEEEASVTEDHTESGTLDHVLKQVQDHHYLHQLSQCLKIGLQLQKFIKEFGLYTNQDDRSQNPVFNKLMEDLKSNMELLLSDKPVVDTEPSLSEEGPEDSEEEASVTENQTRTGTLDHIMHLPWSLCDVQQLLKPIQGALKLGLIELYENFGQFIRQGDINQYPVFYKLEGLMELLKISMDMLPSDSAAEDTVPPQCDEGPEFTMSSEEEEEEEEPSVTWEPTEAVLGDMEDTEDLLDVPYLLELYL